MSATSRDDVVRSVFSTTDAEQGRAYLASAYGTDIRMGAPTTSSRAPFRHERRATAELALDSVRIPAEAHYFLEPGPHLLMTQLLSGRQDVDCAGTDTRWVKGDVMPAGRPDMPHRTHADHVESRTARMEPELLRDVAGLGEEEPREPMRMPRPQEPAPAAHAAVWEAATHRAWDLLGEDSAAGTLLSRDAAARMVAAVALSMFPNSYTEHDPLASGTGNVGEATVDRAAQYIHDHAHRPITLTDLAAAAGVSARTLHDGFRHFHDTTPMGYLRRVRLERAHRELRTAEPGEGESVETIAARWGWGDPHAFSAVYGRAYGTPPSRTLTASGLLHD
ncbi:helix-turn-helix transcriptional regulator [Streptomyces sp. WMMC940]|uniref:helix-turn-helix transcriptional regulator n=1 Tax=Streptomyces sp. WMMC940 TaxID=3015153 RepID=UPI0022B6B18A|nr:helix-turn-helix transcriptional regulator [Streptomyces sp. WMMC940]MCZ7456719.1 helix-turn-helix transcriptional regulator [Streptomyces sp. WMMC940]